MGYRLNQWIEEVNFIQHGIQIELKFNNILLSYSLANNGIYIRPIHD